MASRRTGVVTIADVAEHARVAPSTVSYVLSGKRAISPATRQRVLTSVRVLGYHRHAGARALASNRSNVIALVLPLRDGMHVPVVMRFAVSVVTSARQFDHDVLLVTADEGPDGLRRIAASAMVDGLVLMDVELDDARVPLLRALDRPSVLIGLPADPAGLTCVDLDFNRAGAACVAYLAGHGHRSIGLLGAPQAVYQRGTGFAHRTLAGFREAAARHGLVATAGPCEENLSAVQRRVDEMIAREPRVTALVVHNEAAVEHVLVALRRRGIRVPEDMSIVAICPDEVAERASPPLTSVLVPAEEVGAQAVNLLMHKLEGKPTPESSLLAPRLTARDSTVAAPTGLRDRPPTGQEST